VSPETVIGSLLTLFLLLLGLAIAVSLYDEPGPSVRKQKPKPKSKKMPRKNLKEIQPSVLNHAERMELIRTTRNMVVTQPVGLARLVRNWISDGS
jgi:flagellar biosynthesis/type III secretory pathway M-ring protein FliF/YscJ